MQCDQRPQSSVQSAGRSMWGEGASIHATDRVCSEAIPDEEVPTTTTAPHCHHQYHQIHPHDTAIN